MKTSKRDISDEIRLRVVSAIESIVSGGDVNYKEVAQKIETDFPRISEWKAGKGNPTTTNLSLLCREYFISANYLLTGEGEINNIHSMVRDLVKRVEKLEKAGVRKGVRP